MLGAVHCSAPRCCCHFILSNICPALCHEQSPSFLSHAQDKLGFIKFITFLGKLALSDMVQWA